MPKTESIKPPIITTAIGNFVHKHPALWIKLGNIESCMLSGIVSITAETAKLIMNMA